MPRNAEATKEALLAAARNEFAAHGLAGARVDRIAAAAGVNKERIYAYFGNKERLHDEVLLDAFAEIRAATVPVSDDVGDFVARIYDFHVERPEFLRMLMWESLQTGSGPIAAEDSRRQSYRDKVTMLAELVGAGPEETAATARLLLTLVGLAAWPTAMPTLAHLITDREANAAAERAAMREFVIEFARRGALRGAARG